MGWLSYTNEAKKNKKNKTKNMLVNSIWSWYIGESGNKSIRLEVVSRPNFGWGIEVRGDEGKVLISFWFILKFYINFSGIFPEWIYSKEYNQFADEETKALERDGKDEKRWAVKKLNQNLKGRYRTKEKGWIRTASRELSITFHNYSMWWDIWIDSNEWSNKTPKWRNGNFDFQELLKGKDKVETTLVKEQFGEVEMPEGKYLCRINQKHSIRTYQRWFSNEWNRFEFEFGFYDKDKWIETPVLHWGKGESSWNCGMDGTWSISLSSEVKNLEEANIKVIESCMRDRERYGSIDFSKVTGIEDGIVKKNLIGQF
jgi:hypothetical protein